MQGSIVGNQNGHDKQHNVDKFFYVVNQTLKSKTCQDLTN